MTSLLETLLHRFSVRLAISKDDLYLKFSRNVVAMFIKAI